MEASDIQKETVKSQGEKAIILADFERTISSHGVVQRLLRPAFLRVHEVEEGHDVLAVGEAGLRPLLHEALGGSVAPAALGHEAVPDFDLLGRRPVAVLAAPFEDFLVRAAFERALSQLVEIDTEKLAHTIVKRAVARRVAEVVALGQLALLGEQTDFVEDAAKDKDAADHVTRGTNGKCHASF